MLRRGDRVIATCGDGEYITEGSIYTLLEDQLKNGVIQVRNNYKDHWYMDKDWYRVPTPADEIALQSPTRSSFVATHGSICDELKEITERKNSDYTGNTDDPFANFRQVETFNICTTEQGFLTRMTDKMARIASLIGQGTEAKVKDESIEDTLKDLANYSILLICYLRQAKK